MKQTPLLFLGDAPSLPGGLSRIGRDLALIASRMEEFRVGFLGKGGVPSIKLPFMQYNFPEVDQWGEGWLKDVWDNFAQGEQGVLMTIWDPSRVTWISDPRAPELQWLREPPFRKWGYFPIDHEGPGGRLSVLEADGLSGYDRVLAYGMFGAGVISRTLNLRSACDWIPHGINMDTFQPRDPEGVKLGMGLGENMMVLGVVMTNQIRKNWALAFEIISLLKKRLPPFKVWCKTDSIDRHWDLRALAVDFGVEDVVMVDLTTLSDKQMSYMYSACDLTFLPSLGEGFGYPIVESLACGVPCVHGNYAGGAELMPLEAGWLVEYKGHRYDTRYNCLRPVYEAEDWAMVVEGVLEQKVEKEKCRAMVEHLNWPNLHTVWERWFREGVK